jgi:hypothetical protein
MRLRGLAPFVVAFAVVANALSGAEGNAAQAAAQATPSPDTLAIVRARVQRVFAGTFASVGTPAVRGALARVPYRLHDPQEAAGAGEGVSDGIALVVRYPFGWQVYRLIAQECLHPTHVLTPRDVRDCDTKLRDEGKPPDVSAVRGVEERAGQLVVSEVRIVGAYALANVGSFGVGGQRALAKGADGWAEIGGADTRVDACTLVGYGVPPAIASKLMERAFWPDPVPPQLRSIAACS